LVKRTSRETGHSPSSEVKNAWSSTSTHHKHIQRGPYTAIHKGTSGGLHFASSAAAKRGKKQETAMTGGMLGVEERRKKTLDEQRFIERKIHTHMKLLK
jgi:hypothetical protein